ncbi:MAG TPA: acyl-CoA dehydrogenase family protein [Myxococcota bacterium]|nr:acyl-CoA dehydrogenase family protein [Myxococcota bacterium]
MISFEPTEEQQIARDAMHEFAASALRPVARECDESASLPESLLEEMHQLGLCSTQLPAEHGGGGEARSPITNALVLEALAWGDAGLALAAVAPAAFAFAIADFGTDEQKRALLPLFGGKRFHAASLAVIEPGPASDAALPRTLAEPKGSGFVLSGSKRFVPLADRASHFLVIARNNGGQDAFVVPRDAAGLRIGAPDAKLGLRALPTASLELERVELPASARLGGVQGCDVRRILDSSRAAIAAALTGLARGVLDYAVPYAKEREAFGQAIARKQAIAFRLADMHIEVESMRWLAWKAASRLERGLSATRAAHHAHAYAAEQAMWIADEGVQVLGGHGFIREHPVEMWYRNARTLSVLEGTLGL